MLVEAEQDKQAATNQLRCQRDTTLNQIREAYRNMLKKLSKEKQESKIIVKVS